ncbi:hypothetical protein GCM10010160_01830 [Acrocarpospora corrugata]
MATAPYLLSDELIELFDGTLRDSAGQLPPDAPDRLADLRRLAAGREPAVEPQTAGEAEYRRLAAQQVLLHQQGDTEGARGLAAELVELARRVFGAGSAEFGQQLAQQAVLENQEELFTDAVLVLDEAAPELVPGLVVSFANVQSDPDRALALLTLASQRVDADVPEFDAARVAADLATRLNTANRPTEAEQVIRAALDERRFTGASLARLLVALAESLFAQEEYGEAAQLCERGLDLYRETLGDTHPKVAATARGLGRVHAAAGHLEEAERWLLSAADTWRALDNPMETALTDSDLAGLYARAGATGTARQAATRALESLEPGDTHPQAPEILSRVRAAYHDLGDLENELAAQQRLAAFDRDGAEMNNLADIHYRAARFDEAAHWYGEALARATPDKIFLVRHNLANALHSLDRIDEAVGQHERALTEMRAALPADDPDLLHALVDVAGIIAATGDTGRAVELIAEAEPHLDARLRAKAASVAAEFGLDVPGLGSAAEPYRLLVEQARTARAARDYDEAERLLGQALRIVSLDPGPDSIDAARLKLFLAAVRRDHGVVAGVEELIREAIDILPPGEEALLPARRELGLFLVEQHRDEEARALLADAIDDSDGDVLGRVRSALGLIAQRRGDLGAAEQHYRAALDLAESQDNQLISRKNLTLLLIEAGRLDEAHDLAEETIGLTLTWYGADDPRIGRALLPHAKIQRHRGDFRDAERIALAALHLLGVDDSGRADAENEIGLGLSGQGRSAEAGTWFRRAATTARGDVVEETTLLLNQAHGYEELGDAKRAISLVTKALGLLEESVGRDSARYGVALGHLGRLRFKTGDWTAATTLSNAITTIEAARDDHPSLVGPLCSLATLYLGIGADDTATAFARRALTIAEAAHGPASPLQTAPLIVLARCTAVAGDLDEAARLFERGLTLHPEGTENLRLYAYFQAARGNREAALDLLDLLIQREDETLRDVMAAATPERRRGGFFAKLWTTVDAYLTLATPGHATRAWELLVRRLGQDSEQLRLEREGALRGSGRPILEDLALVRARLARAALRNDSPQTDHLLNRRDDLESLLAAFLPADPDPPTATRIATSLPPGTTLITYVQTRIIDFANLALGTPPTTHDGLHAHQPRHYLAFVVTSPEPQLGDPGQIASDGPRMILLGDADQIDADLARLRELLIPRLRANRADERDACAAALREQLFDPLDIRDRRVLIVAGGRLGLLPFQLLPLPGTGRLIDEYEISYLSAPRDLLRWTKPVRQRVAGPPLVIADPDYDLGSAAPSRAVRPLPGSAVEGREAAALLGTEAITGARAVKITLASVQSPLVVHLATHGFFMPSPEPPPLGDHYESVQVLHVPGEGDFVVGAERVRPPVQDSFGFAGSDPLLRSAVAFAGVNTWLSGSTPPVAAGIGLLTADEVCTLDLRDTRLVVLSACDTGLGEHRSDEGLVGLRWAFAVAGAQTLVSTLWQIPDRATADLMKEFYTHLTAGQSVPNALRTAQLTVRSRNPDPFAWAAFVTHGNPTTNLTQYRPISENPPT